MSSWLALARDDDEMKQFRSICKICMFLIEFIACDLQNRMLQEFVQSQSQIYTTNHRSYFSEYFKEINFLNIVILERGNRTSAGDHRAQDFVSELLPKVFPNLSFPVHMRTVKTNDEPKMFDHLDRFAWNGQKFELRSRQCDCVEVYAPNERVLKVSEVFDKRVGLIVIADELEIFDEFLVGIPRFPFGNPSGYFVMNFLEGWSPEKSKMLQALLRRLWHLYGILRITLLFNGDNKKIFQYDPFALKENGKYGRIFVEDFGNHSKSLQITQGKYPITFNGYPFRVFFFDRYPSAMNWSIYPKSFLSSYQCEAKDYSKLFGGFDGIFMGNMAKLLNFSIITRYPRAHETNIKYGWRGKNGTVHGSVGHVMYSRVDIGGNGHFIQSYGTTSVTFLTPTYYDLLCLITSKAKAIPKSMAIVNCFGRESWTAILMLHLAAGVLWYICKRINYQWHSASASDEYDIDSGRMYSTKSKPKFFILPIIIQMWLLLTCHSINTRQSRGFERFFLIGCMLSSILFNSSIQGYLSKTFFKVTYEKDIKTLRELNEANIRVVIPAISFRNLFGNKSKLTGYLAELTDKVVVDEGDQRYLAIRYHNVSFVDRKSDFDIIEEEFKFPNGTTLLNLVEECPRIAFLSFVVRRGWAFEEKFIRMLGLIDAAGLRSKWYGWSRYAIVIKWRMRNLKVMVANYRERSFDVADIKIAILVHIYGNILSLIIFAIEHITHYYGKIQHKKTIKGKGKQKYII